MREAIGEDIAESSCFLMVTLDFGRVNSTVVWCCAAPAAAKEEERSLHCGRDDNERRGSKRCRAEARRSEGGEEKEEEGHDILCRYTERGAKKQNGRRDLRRAARCIFVK